MAKPTFSYPKRSVEDVQRRAKQSSGRYDSYLTAEVTWFRPKPGENCIRLIPWLSGDDKDYAKYEEKWGNHWGIDIIVHRNVGQDNGTYLCLDKMKGEPCPPCDAWRGEDLDELKPSDRVLCWLIDRNDEKAGVQAWSMPLGVSKDISAASQVKGSGEVLLIDHPDEGYDVFFDVEGEKKRTQYKRVSVARDPSSLAESQKTQDAWLMHVLDNRLPDLLKYYETEYLEKILSGGQRGNGEAKEDNVRPIHGGRRDAASDDREDNSRGREFGDPNLDRPARRRYPEDEAESSADHDHEAAEAKADKDYSHRRRLAAAEEDVSPSRERRRPAAAEDREPDAADRARGKLEKVGRGRR